MKLQIKYYGLIADFTHKSEEVFFTDLEKFSINDLLYYLCKDYSELVNLSFKIAINHKINTEDTNLKENDIIALLPPFAGG